MIKNLYFKCLSLPSLLIIISFISLSNQFYKFSNLTDVSFNYEVQDPKVKWLVLFYTETCTKCEIFINLLKDLMQKYKDENVAFCLVDVNKNQWLSRRFEIERIPQLIIIENYYYYTFKSILSIEKLQEFIDKKKLPAYGKRVPTANLYPVFKKYLFLLLKKIKNNLQNDVLNKLKINYQIQNYQVIILVISTLVLSLMILIKILKKIPSIFCFILCCGCLCSRKSKKEYDDVDEEPFINSSYNYNYNYNNNNKSKKRKANNNNEPEPPNNYTKKKKEPDVSKYEKKVVITKKKYKND